MPNMQKKSASTRASKTAPKSTRQTTKKAATKTTSRTTKKASALFPAPKKKSASRIATLYKGVAIGASVPSFRVASTGGREFTATDLKGKITILYFYPKDNTPGCTLEGHDFKARHNELQRLGAQVVGVSRDSLRSHESFKGKCGFPFELLSDENDQLGKIFDVIQMKKLYGRVFEGIERSTFVIGADGRLLREWRKVKVDGHADEVVQYIRDTVVAR